jgi:hypothetical protein
MINFCNKNQSDYSEGYVINQRDSNKNNLLNGESLFFVQLFFDDHIKSHKNKKNEANEGQLRDVFMK